MLRRPVLTLLVLASTLSSVTARAQSKSELSTVRFYPAVGTGNFVTVDGAGVGGHKSTSFGVMFDYSADTLRVDQPCEGIRNVDPGCRNQATSFVHGTGLFHLMGSVSLFDKAQLSLDLPVGFTDSRPFYTEVRTASGGSPSIGIQPSEGYSLADARLAAKYLIAGGPKEVLRFSASAFTTVPTGILTSESDCKDQEACSFLGERGAQVGASVISEFAIPEVRVSANVGAAYRPERTFLTEQTETELRYGVAGQYYITPLFSGMVEIAGAASLLGGGDSPLEARGAIQYGQDLVVTAGGAGGVIEGVGNPTWRAFLGVQWTPTKRDADNDGLDDDDDACPSDAEDADNFMDEDGCPESDNDGDKVPDKNDACVNQREDFDKFEDEDGCPEEDNDRDGVPDGYDSCEGKKEDIDGDRDEDGCPDNDTDRDGVQDVDDKCVNEPEDSDGLGDEDGCPEEDFDGDAVKDIDDACPDASEWWNGIADEDGCPEDDGDADTVPDTQDRCPDNAETLNGVTDSDGCPDGAVVIVLNGQRLLPTNMPELVEGKTEIKGAAALVDAIVDYEKRNHRKGSLRVVLIAPAEDKLAAGRAESLAALIRKRAINPVTSAHLPGSPARFEIELLPPGVKELYRPKPPAAAVPPPAPASAAAPAAPATPAAPTAAPAPAPAAAPATAPAATKPDTKAPAPSAPAAALPAKPSAPAPK